MNNRKIGIVQALGLGYESVVRSIWVVLIPIGLDLFFWLGPHLSIRSLFERLVADMAAASQSTPDFAQNMDEMRAALTAVGSSVNLFSLLATRFMGIQVLPVPSLKAFELPADLGGSLPAISGPVVPVEGALPVLLVSAVLLAAGLLIGVIYLTLIADRVRGSQPPARPLPQRIIRHWLWLLLFVVLLTVASFFASIPFLLVAVLAYTFFPAVGALIMIAGLTVGYWILLYLWFVSYALVMDDVGIVRAIWYSANVVQRNLFPTFGLVVLSYIIVQGMLVVWQMLEANAFGNLLAIAGNAFIGSGLVAASFFWYQDRLRAWQSQSAPVPVIRRAVR